MRGGLLSVTVCGWRVVGDGTWWERVSVTVCGWRVVGDGGTRGESVRESEGE